MSVGDFWEGVDPIKGGFEVDIKRKGCQGEGGIWR